MRGGRLAILTHSAGLGSGPDSARSGSFTPRSRSSTAQPTIRQAKLQYVIGVASVVADVLTDPREENQVLRVRGSSG